MEYIGLNQASQVYLKKNLLYCEMGLLNSLKRYQKYKKLRKEETLIKDFLRKKISRIKEEFKELDKTLPRVEHKELLAASLQTPREKKHRSQLEEEIDEIKRKLEELNS